MKANIGCFSEPIPRKGTETSLSNCWSLRVFSSFSEPIPRKGTETQGFSKLGEQHHGVFQNLFPARGRKLLLTQQGFRLSCKKYGFSEPIPRKGTETILLKKLSKIIPTWFFRTYSPQGDGNFVFVDPIAGFNSGRFSEPIPRKGTET